MTEINKKNCQKFSNDILEVDVDELEINKKVEQIRHKATTLTGGCRTASLLKAISFIDLTTLGGGDTSAVVEALCQKAVRPLPIPYPGTEALRTAAICVYPLRLSDAIAALRKLDPEHAVSVASVAGGFPSGQYPLETRLREVELAIGYGANEIDIVINRPLALTHKWKELHDELIQFRTACTNETCLKTILATGELGSLTDVYKASMVAMMAGCDFIKTSTGKETVNATLPVGIIMCRAIKDYYKQSQRKVGLKPAGGIKTAQDALEWMELVRSELGEEWLTKDLFRIGASSLLDNIAAAINSE